MILFAACLASFLFGCLLCGLAALTHSGDLSERERQEAAQRHLYEG